METTKMKNKVDTKNKHVVDKKKKKKKQKGFTEIEMGGLFEELVEKIFSCIDIKTLTRMKCVSKGWCHLISHSERSRKVLVCQYMVDVVKNRKQKEVTLVEVKEQGGGEVECLYNSPIYSLKENFQFLGTSNGLLLGKRDKFPVTKLYVCNPMLKTWVCLPCDDRFWDTRRHAIGLAFNGLPPDQHYDVVCCSFHERSLERSVIHGVVECLIFSSKTKQWRLHKARLLNSPNIIKQDFYRLEQYLFRNGVLHWAMKHNMLVYHLKEKAFKLIKLPTKEQSRAKELTNLSGSERGLHCCCYNEDRFCIWRYVGDNLDDENGYKKDDDDLTTDEKWQLKYTVDIDSLTTQHPDIFRAIPKVFLDPTTSFADIYFHPFDFDEDLQTLQLHVPGMILSYSFHTQRLTKLWTYRLPDPISSNKIYEQVLSFLDKCFPIAFVGLNMATRGEPQLYCCSFNGKS